MSLVGVRTSDAFQRDDGLMVYSRQEFAAHRFPYKAGQHVIFGGPTGQGKTRLAGALLTYAASPSCPALVAVTKPDDKETADLGARLGYRRVTTWPPPPKWKETFGEKPSGYLIWPQFGDIDTDTDRAAEITGDLMAHTYAGGAKGKHAILVMDDTMVKARVLHLDGRMVTILAMAGAMGVGLWIFVQKPTDSGRTTLWGFENGTHFFMAKGGEGRMRDRYVEIAGDNGPIVKRTLPTLKPYQFLYIHRYEGWVCIVDAN